MVLKESNYPERSQLINGLEKNPNDLRRNHMINSDKKCNSLERGQLMNGLEGTQLP